MITIFTATYNRAFCLPQLYKSLCNQNNKNFEWLVINDGSTDETETQLEQWKHENIINIRYVSVENAGKSAAINTGVTYAFGDIFFIVDSDDYITENAIDLIYTEFNKISEKENYSGVCFRKAYYNSGKLIGKKFGNIQIANTLDLTYKYNIYGDKAEVFYTERLKEYPFPKIPNCKFIPEALVWNRIAHAGYIFVCSDYPIYLCEYLRDGYTKNFKKNLKKNAAGFALYYRECLFYAEISCFQKIKYLIRFIQCSIYLGYKKNKQ